MTVSANGATTSVRESRAFIIGGSEGPWFLLRLMALLGTFFLILLHLPPRVIQQLNCSTAQVTGTLLNALGRSVDVTGSILKDSDFSMQVIVECTALYETIILASCILAYPTTLRKKLAGICLGLATILCFNILRMAFLFLLGASYPVFFDLFHYYLMHVVFMALVLYIWMLWTDRVVRGERMDDRLIFLGKFLLCTIAVSVVWANASNGYYLLLKDLLNGILPGLSCKGILSGDGGLLTYHYSKDFARPLNMSFIGFSMVAVVSLLLTLPNIPFSQRIAYVGCGTIGLFALHSLYLLTFCLGFCFRWALIVEFSLFLGCIVNILAPFILAIGFLYRRRP